MTSMIRSKAFRVLAASLVTAVALTVSASEAKAMDAHVDIDNHRCESVNVFIDGYFRARVYAHGENCFNVHSCCSDCFTITVRSDCGCVLLDRHVHVCGCNREFSFCVH